MPSPTTFPTILNPERISKIRPGFLAYRNTKDAIQTLTIAMMPRNMARKEYLAILSDGLTAAKMNITRQAMKKILM